MIWHLLKYWLSFFLPTFYKRIQSHNIRHLQTSDPVIIAMNHPNAFTDPTAFTYVSYPLRLHYMARGDAFKHPIAAWLLEQIGIVPVYRIQDAGKEGLLKNEATYRRVNRLLERNAKVMVFAEGLCIQERRLRPLKKGVARMVFGAFEHLNHDRLKVVPVGVNYSKPDKFRSKLFYNIGEPILVRDYYEAYKDNPAKTMNVFRIHLENRMRELVVHIDDPAHDDIVHWVEKLSRREILRSENLNEKKLVNEFEVSKRIVAKVERVAKTNPPLLQEFREKAAAYFSELKQLGMKDWLFAPRQATRNNMSNLLLRSVLLLLLSPLYLAGMVFNLPPLLCTRAATRKFVKVIEFYSSFFFGIAMCLFPVFYGLWFYIFYTMTENLPAALGCCLLAALAGWACLHIHPLLLRTIGLARYLRMPAEAARLREMRTFLTGIINKF